jgi:outer membrane protein OmpA-like peptidoglycan-associated protein
MKTTSLLFALSLLPGLLQAQGSAPIYQVTVTSKTAKAINYRQGSTKIDFKGTSFMPLAVGEGKVESKGTGNISLQIKFQKMESTAKFGPPFMTYVLWAVSPEGRARNLGPVRLNRDKAEVMVTTNLVNFALIVTAEPYFAVTVPSEIVVLENEPRSNTKGKVEMVDAKYELFQRGYWTEGKFDAISTGAPAGAPYELFEARNAMRIAKWQQADKYAADVFTKAEASMKQAEEYASRKKIEFKPAQMIAREATQNAEDARVVAIKRIQQEKLDNERKAAAQREADAKAAQEAAERQRQAEAEARIRAQQEAARQTEAKAQADAARRQAELEAQKAAAAKAQADAAKAEADALRRKAEDDRRALRASLLARFNQILETTDSERGLVVNMADVLFDTGKFNLRSEAREKLAKFSGIVLNYPTLNVTVEGHTDSTGSDELNQKLSEQRAEQVAAYLTKDGGLPAANITSAGFGKTRPVDDNKTAKGRQRNRRVELIISGEVIGTKIQ